QRTLVVSAHPAPPPSNPSIHLPMLTVSPFAASGDDCERRLLSCEGDRQTMTSCDNFGWRRRIYVLEVARYRSTCPEHRHHCYRYVFIIAIAILSLPVLVARSCSSFGSPSPVIIRNSSLVVV